MASSKKTGRLGLNLWTETDKPERADFVSDNQKLEELVGVHVNSSSLHLTAAEKTLIQKPLNYFIYTGDGNASKTYYMTFAPTFVCVFATGKPQGVYEDDLYGVFSGMQLGPYKTAGVSVNGANIVISQQTAAQAREAGTGYRLRLNEKGVAYCIIAMR